MGEGRLLLVDDDPAVSRLMQRVLERAGWTVQSHGEAADAVAAAEAAAPAIAVIDLGLHPDGGIALARSLRAVVPGLPLLFVSGAPPDPEQSAWLDEAGAHFVAKPFSPAGLTEVVTAIARPDAR